MKHQTSVFEVAMKISQVFAVVAAACLLGGCAGGTPTDTPTNTTPSGDVDFVFAGALETYGQSLTADDHDRQLLARAIRRIDPCGFVDSLQVSQQVSDLDFRTYRPSFDHCTLAQSSQVPESKRSEITLSLVTSQQKLPDKGFEADGVRVSEYRRAVSCSFYVHLNLGSLPGAPITGSVRDLVENTVLLVNSERSGDPNCEQAKSIATTAAHIRSTRIPNRNTTSSLRVPLAERDPCALASNIDGYTRYQVQPVPEPYGCVFTKDRNTNDYVRVSLVPITINSPEFQATAEQVDGLTLHVGKGYGECVVRIAVGGTFQPLYSAGPPPKSDNLQSGAVEVRGNTCDVNKRTAIAAAKALS